MMHLLMSRRISHSLFLSMTRIQFGYTARRLKDRIVKWVWRWLSTSRTFLLLGLWISTSVTFAHYFNRSAPKTLDAYKNMASNLSVPATATTTSGSLYASVTSLIASAASNAPLSTPMSYVSGASSVMTTGGSLGALVIAGAAGLIMF